MKPKKYMTLKIIPTKNGFDLKEVDAIPIEVIEDLIDQGKTIIESEVDMNMKNNVRKKMDFLHALIKTWKAKNNE